MKLCRYQQECMSKIEQLPEFDRWLIDPAHMKGGLSTRMQDDRAARLPKLFCYYTKDGSLHCVRVSDEAVLSHSIFAPPHNT